MLHPGEVVVPAPRGLIVDSTGHVLVDNTSVEVMTIDQDRLDVLPDHGASRAGAYRSAAAQEPGNPRRGDQAVLVDSARAVLDGRAVPTRAGRNTLVAQGDSRCHRASRGLSRASRSRPSPTRNYPHGALAGQVLGYTSQITAADKRNNPAFSDADTIGVSGLEEQYDSVLRGVDGSLTKNLSPQGYSVSDGKYVAPVQGDTLVTSLNLKLQRLAEQSLAQQLVDSRKLGKPASAGAIVAHRSADRSGARRRELSRLQPAAVRRRHLDEELPQAHRTERERPAAQQCRRRPVRTGLDVQAHHVEFARHPPRDQPQHALRLPRIGDDRRPGQDELRLRGARRHRPRECTRVLVRHLLLRPGRQRVLRRPEPHRAAQEAARVAPAHGGVLRRRPCAAHRPAGQRAGHRLLRRPRDPSGAVEGQQGSVLRRGARRLQERANLSQRAYLTELASENCTDGWRYRAGDNADMAIGQGETTMSPLQLAVAYSALVNGGRIWAPKLGWGVVDGKGKLVRDDHAEGAQQRAGQAEHARLHRAVAELRPRMGGVRCLRLHRVAVRGTHRRQDGHRRGVRPAATRRGSRPGGRSTTSAGMCVPASSSSGWSSRAARAPPPQDRCSSASGTASSAWTE